MVGFYVGPYPTVMCKDIEMLKSIQIKDSHKFQSRQILTEVGAIDAHSRQEKMLIVQHGQRWKEVRSILTPTFNASKMKQSVPLINDAIDALLENVEAKSKADEQFDIYKLFQGLTMDTIGRSAFGIRTNVQKNPDDEFFKAAQMVFSDQIRNQFLKNFLFLLNICFPEFWPVLYSLRWVQYRILEALGMSHNALLYNVCRQIVDARRKNIDDPNNPWSHQDLLQGMMNARSNVDRNMNQLTADLGSTNETEKEIKV